MRLVPSGPQRVVPPWLQDGDDEWQEMFETLAAAKEAADPNLYGAGDRNRTSIPRSAIDETTRRRLDEMDESVRGLKATVAEQLAKAGRIDGKKEPEPPSVLTKVLSTVGPDWAKQYFSETDPHGCDFEGCAAARSERACPPAHPHRNGCDR